MSKREAWRQQLRDYVRQMEYWQSQPVTKNSSQEIIRLQQMISQHKAPENRPK